MRRRAPLLLLALLLLSGPRAGAAEPTPPGVPDKELQEAIDRAIQRGGAWLEGQQKASGLIGAIQTRGDVFYKVGTTALGGLALLAAGRSRGASSVDRALAYCRQQDELLGQAGSRTTYDVGVLLMFVTEYYRPKDEDDGRPGRTVTGRRSKNPCDLPPEALQWVQDLANFLVAVRKRETSTWGYPMNRDDLSNTQYAYLGLRAARDCGAQVPAQVFLTGLETMIARQETDGPKVPRIVPGGGPGESNYAIESGDRARGWSYLQEPFVATGSMTTAAIAVLAICNDALLRPKRFPGYKPELERQVGRSAQDGFAWLDRNWDVARNPGRGAPNWHYYYLYGLERACVLGGRDTLGVHDWYLEGARLLVKQQREDGRWATGALGDTDYEASDVVDTAWAILFLKRATRPAPPLRAPVVTEGD